MLPCDLVIKYRWSRYRLAYSTGYLLVQSTSRSENMRRVDDRRATTIYAPILYLIVVDNSDVRTYRTASERAW